MIVNLKIICLILLYSHFSFAAKAQIREDSLRAIINLGNRNEAEVDALNALILTSQLSFDSAQYFAQHALGLAEEIKYKKGMAESYLTISDTYLKIYFNIEVAQFARKALDIYEALGDKIGMLRSHNRISLAYMYIGEFEQAKEEALAALSIAKDTTILIPYPGWKFDYTIAINATLGHEYLKINRLDSSLYHAELAVKHNQNVRDALWNYPLYVLASVYSQIEKYEQSLVLFRAAIPLAVANGLTHDTLQIQSGIGKLFYRMGQLDSAIFYSQKVNRSTDPGRETIPWLEAIETLKECYKSNRKYDSALKYTELYAKLNDSIFSKEKALYVQKIISDELLNQQELKASQDRLKSRTRTNALLAGLGGFLIIAFLLWRSNRRKQIAKAKIEKAYSELKAAQTQLIHTEKMASLGELTAGIAHEIQNPLNFINNFSGVNKELLEEANTALGNGDQKEAKALIGTVIENEDKIKVHGDRADAIVKSMLQHSRISTGQKELTDINTLCDKYLRLTFHGMRARDKEFNAELKTDFDPSIGGINLVPQDIGRVLLNLYNNAFQAVSTKVRDKSKDYQPKVSVITRQSNGKIEIEVKDNGPGIPDAIKEKIFQPFFTTKPTGQGTGLGLSLSYDIIKAHGGEIKVETKQGDGTAFILMLPDV